MEWNQHPITTLQYFARGTRPRWRFERVVGSPLRRRSGTDHGGANLRVSEGESRRNRICYEHPHQGQPKAASCWEIEESKHGIFISKNHE